MSRVQLASDRLAKALDRLEAAVLPLAKARDSARESASKAENMTADRDRLMARVTALEEDAKVLSGLTEEVESRLDGAISEIRAALGR
jgi:hypothetical protein